jgi:heavy metal sensor kinase
VKPLPVRTRLTLWFVALFVVIVSAWSTYVIMRVHADLYSGIDRTLASRATQLAAVLKTSGGNSAFKSASEASLVGVVPAEAVSQLLSSQGAVLQHSGDQVSGEPIVDPQLLATVHDSGQAKIETVYPSGKKFRVLLAPLPKSDRFIVVGQATESSDLALERIILVMVLSAPLAIIAAALVGWFVARQALRPLSRMISTASNISINHLDERVTVPEGQDELHDLAETLNDMLERLETGVRDKRRLVSNASHELQTPLAVMRTELDVYLATAELPEEAREVLESVREESDRMSRIVRNLLTLARFDDGRLKLLPEMLDLHDIAEEAAGSLSELARERNVTVSVEGTNANAPADPEYLRLVVSNLLENAIRYSGAGSHVTLDTRSEGDEVALIVEDTGQGIPASAIPHLFDRFFRVESARAAENSGSGLGLAITKEIVSAHGGTVSVESELDKGTRFTVRLPKFKRNRS